MESRVTDVLCVQVLCAVESMGMMLHGHQDERSRQLVAAPLDLLRMTLVVNCLSCNYLNK